MKTHEILGFSHSEFQDIYFEAFICWAKIYSSENTKMLQLLVINKSVAKWFEIEFNKKLKEFKTVIKPYLNEEKISQSDRRQMFVEVITKIYFIYPKALLIKVKPIKQHIK